MSGLLAGLYSAGDRMKRKLGGLLSNPLETIALGSTRMAEDTNALTRLVSEAGYMPNTVNRADQSVLVSERQKALARALLADKAAEMGANMVGATVWHGPLKKNDLSRNELQDLISSQRYLDRDIVAKKIRDGNFDVRVTPRFEIQGESVRAITDGHHALEAAIRSGNKPKFVTDTVRTNDRVGLLSQGAIDDYLEAAYHDSPWYRFATKVDLF